jgi:hypothetical protein
VPHTEGKSIQRIVQKVVRIQRPQARKVKSFKEAGSGLSGDGATTGKVNIENERTLEVSEILGKTRIAKRRETVQVGCYRN